MNREEKKRYLRLIYARTFRYLAVGLVLSMIIGALYGQSMYTVWAMCAIGSILLCWGWFTYLQTDGVRFSRWKGRGNRVNVPYVHQRFKNKRPHRPAFQKDSTDFQDDLSSATSVDEEQFSEKQREMARAWSRAAAGVLLFLVSFLI